MDMFIGHSFVVKRIQYESFRQPFVYAKPTSRFILVFPFQTLLPNKHSIVQEQESKSFYSEKGLFACLERSLSPSRTMKWAAPRLF